MKILSLGWGIQSWTLAAMVALGELPPIDFAIHADTTYEYEHTYLFAKEQSQWLRDMGIKIITVNDKKQAEKVETGHTDIPAFTINPKGNLGQLRRQCTNKWKITPVQRYLAAELKKRGLKKKTGIITQWLGISTDEVHRIKPARFSVKYINHEYPLIKKNMSRTDCVTWLKENKLPIPSKSACIFCPYHSRKMWEEMKKTNNNDWKKAIKIDKKIRNTRPPYPLYVHNARKPLEKAVSIPEDYGAEQLNFDNLAAECDSGYCFL